MQTYCTVFAMFDEVLVELVEAMRAVWVYKKSAHDMHKN